MIMFQLQRFHAGIRMRVETQAFVDPRHDLNIVDGHSLKEQVLRSDAPFVMMFYTNRDDV